MGKYLDILRARRGHEKNEFNEISGKSTTSVRSKGGTSFVIGSQRDTECRASTKEVGTSAPAKSLDDGFFRLNRFFRAPSALAEALSGLERECPALVPPAHWQQAVKDGHRFLSRWGEQAEAFGWTPADLFGLHEPPTQPHPSYSRLSRRDCTGLVWLLDGRAVVALTAETATIKAHSGSVLTYRRVLS
jgi:hypothetical protein